MNPVATSKISEIKKRKDDGSSSTITVEQIENGFLIIKSKEWKDNKEGWNYETKKYFSEDDPLAGAGKELADFFDE